MSEHSSGYYSIDADYNIIGFNDTAKQLYPNLVLGQKCYKVLMGLDSPCGPCPVAAGIRGPKTYLDPIRHIYETVDAVETVLADGSRGHALVFSTVDEGERLSSAIPTGEGSLRLLGAINLLSNKYQAVFGVDLQTQRVSIYRAGEPSGVEMTDNMTYQAYLELLISRWIHPEEQETVRRALELEAVRRRLEASPSFKVHFRVLQQGVHYYYLLIARNGEAADFSDIVVAIACEDDDVANRRIYQKQLDALLGSLTHAAGYFHLDLTANRILRVGGTSAIVDELEKDCPIDTLMQGMAIYILTDKDRQDFLQTYNVEQMKQAYEAGKVEVIRESRCYYDDHVARWSRYTLRLFVNPSNSHLEGVFYGMDVTRDRQAYETQVSIVQTLSSNYLDVLLVNTREKTATVIKRDGGMSSSFGSEAHPYDQVLADYITRWVHPDDQSMMTLATRIPTVLEALAQKQEYTGNYRVIDAGNTHYYQFRYIRSEEYGIVVLGFLNVDEIVAAEIQQQQRLQKALDDAKRANAEKSRFLARMSHDMRTPLNGIVGLLEIDRNHADDVAYLMENRRKAVLVTNHLVSLINDVLDMAKIEEGSLTLAHEPFSLIQDGREATVLINFQAQEVGITAEVDAHTLPPELTYVYGSPLHLRRAMMNIYSNCIKYNRENGKIHTEVQIVHHDEKTVTYRWIISDTGIGMSQEFLQRMFDPFVQAEVDARSVYHGTGLGMSISKALIEQMGGTLEVSSQLGVGSTFVVTIPFERAREEDVVKPEQTEVPSIQNMRILLAEDNELNREIAETLLQESGAQVTCVVNGREAVQTIVNNPMGTFDLVLMDVMMPELDGLEATRAIRSLNRPDALTLPIVAMTANAFSEDVAQCKAAGMNEHIAKPLDVPKMLRTIAQYKKKE